MAASPGSPNPPGPPGSSHRLRLEKVTPDNVDAAIALKVGPGQERFVSPVVKSLAEAYVHPETAWPRLIHDGDELAHGRQGRGYGRFAVDAVCAEIRRRGQSRVTVTWAEGEGGPEPFYLRLGFRRTGETSGDQVVGELDLAGT
ncbi:GNAT family N-acetyltransferase [Streptomyces avermitilis]|uniref:GNAT family N-acetyltransferase n=1 Tax=Streptomyces avermitilis TaxID=33903 RepID=UPI0033EDEF8D